MPLFPVLAASSVLLSGFQAQTPPAGAVPAHAVTFHFRNGVEGYSGSVDRVAGGETGVAHASTAFPSSYWLRYGPPRTDPDQRYNYLIRFDIAVIPANAQVQSAVLFLKSGNVYSPAVVTPRPLLDPDSLGGSFAAGWSTAGEPGRNSYRTGANAVFRNQTGVNQGARWTNADASDEHSHIDNAAGAPEPGAAVRWEKPNFFYGHTVTRAVQDWVNGSVRNQGWLVSASGEANIQDNFTNQAPTISSRPELVVTFLPAPGGDSIPPSNITDLAVTGCTIDSCTLTWTAPGNDDAWGTASAYDIRYANTPLTQENWDSAVRVVPQPAPRPGGEQETFIVTSLSQAIHYYFGVRALDAAYNFAGMSNLADGKTAPGIFVTYHPRIHINRDLNLQKLKDISRGPLRSDFEQLRTVVDDGMSWNFDDLEENDLLSAVYAFGYMYLMTDNPRYADKLIDDYLVKSGWFLSENTNDNAAFGLECAAIAYDWTWARLAERDASTDPGLMARIVEKIRRHYAETTDDPVFFRENIREADFHNFVTEYINSWLVAGLALYGDHPDSIPMIKRGWGMLGEGYSFQPTAFRDTFTYYLKASIDMTGGAMNWEGQGYWKNAVPEVLRAIEAIDSASNRQAGLWHTVFSNTVNAGYYKLYSMRPDLTTPGIGDSNSGAGFSWKDNFALVLLMSRFQDPYLRRLIDTNRGDWLGGRRSGLVMKLLFYDPEVASEDFSTLPTSRKFGREILMRSGWGPDATCVTFSAGFSGVFHTHLDDNSFTVYKYADLAPDGGYALIGPYFDNYFRRTVAHNAITVTDPNDCWRDSGKDCTLSNDGGQRWPFRRLAPPFSSFEYGINRLWSATVLDDPVYREQFLTADVAFEPGDRYDYVNSDATRAYANQWSGDGQNGSRRVSKAVRELLFLKPDWIVVLDRVSSTNAGFRKSWLLHTPAAPKAFNGGHWETPAAGITDWLPTIFRADNGGGSLYVAAVRPADTQMRVVGGPGYEGWVEGRNYWAAGVPASAAKWRLEVSPAAPGNDDLFLNVLYATRPGSGMPPVRPVDSPTAAGVLIDEGGEPKVVVFSPGRLRSRVSYSAAYSGSGAHVVADLERGSYDVSRNGTRVASGLQCSPQGVLTFTAAGGDFEITRAP